MKVLTKYRKFFFVVILILFSALFIVPTSRQAVFSQGCSGTVNPNCNSGCCLATNQVWMLPDSSAQACTWSKSYCIENWIKNYTVSCPGPRDRDCRTETWDQGRCEWHAGHYCRRISYNQSTNCCTGTGGPNPTPCTPEYDPPVVSLSGYTPPYPLVFGQDPDKLGIAVTILAQGGSVNNSCGSGRLQITQLTLDGVSLSPASASWIHGYLASRYPGAKVLGSYPLTPAATTSSLPAVTATLDFHFDPLDPGFYNVVVTATQSDGQTTTSTLSVPVHLLDSTITMP
jgi:hypothetical protein